MRQKEVRLNMKKLLCICCTALIWGLFGNTQAMAASDTGHGYEILESNDLFFVGNTEKIQEFSTEELEEITAVPDGYRVIGKQENQVYYLDNNSEFGRNFISYDLLTKESTMLTDKIRNADYWNGNIVMSGMRTDVGPVKFMFLDDSGTLSMIDEHCVFSYTISDDYVYYLRFDMDENSDTSWNGLTLCRLNEEGQAEELTSLELGSALTAQPAGIHDGSYYYSIRENQQDVYKAVNLETLQISDAETPVPDPASDTEPD